MRKISWKNGDSVSFLVEFVVDLRNESIAV